MFSLCWSVVNIWSINWFFNPTRKIKGALLKFWTVICWFLTCTCHFIHKASRYFVLRWSRCNWLATEKESYLSSWVCTNSNGTVFSIFKANIQRLLSPFNNTLEITLNMKSLRLKVKHTITRKALCNISKMLFGIKRTWRQYNFLSILIPCKWITLILNNDITCKVITTYIYNGTIKVDMIDMFYLRVF